MISPICEKFLVCFWFCLDLVVVFSKLVALELSDTIFLPGLVASVLSVHSGTNVNLGDVSNPHFETLSF